MADKFHDFDLSADALNICLLEDEIFLQYLNGNMFPCEYMDSQPDFAEVALSDGFDEIVAFEFIFILLDLVNLAWF